MLTLKFAVDKTMINVTSIKKFFKKYAFIGNPFFVVIGGGFLLYYFPFPFVPDFFHITEYSKIYELFNLIISSLVSLIGIYISVSLVAYEFFKQKSGIDLHKSFLINRLNAYYISFSVFTILCSFISSIIIPNINPTNREVSVIYYNAILFVFVIACFFPIAFNLFTSLKPEKLANAELQKINSETIFIKVAENENIDLQSEYIENDPLLKIESIVVALIAEKDNLKARSIIQKVAIKLSDLIIDEQNIDDKEYIIERLISFNIKIIDFSLSQPNNSVILRSIWLAVDSMYSVLSKRKETTKHFEKFHNYFFQRYFNRLIQNNNEEMIYEGIKTVRHIIQKQVLKNMPTDEKIYSLNGLRSSIDKTFEYPKDYSEEDFINAEHWRQVAYELMNCFSYLINKAIIHNKPDLINQCFEQMNALTFKFHLEKIGIYKQSYFYIICSNKICDYAYRAFEKNVFFEGHDAKDLTPSLFTNLIEEKHPAARTVLQKYCYLLINLQKLNKLDRWFLGGLSIGDFITTEGELGGIAKRCIIKYKNGIEVQNCLDDCIETFKIIKEYYELNPPVETGLYKIIRWQFEHILEYVNSEKIEDQLLIAKLTNLIESFK